MLRGDLEVTELMKRFETHGWGIISATRPDLTEWQNMQRNGSMYSVLRALFEKVIPVTGLWEGEEEDSFLVFWNRLCTNVGEDCNRTFVRLGFLANQDAVITHRGLYHLTPCCGLNECHRLVPLRSVVPDIAVGERPTEWQAATKISAARPHQNPVFLRWQLRDD